MLFFVVIMFVWDFFRFKAHVGLPASKAQVKELSFSSSQERVLKTMIPRSLPDYFTREEGRVAAAEGAVRVGTQNWDGASLGISLVKPRRRIPFFFLFRYFKAQLFHLSLCSRKSNMGYNCWSIGNRRFFICFQFKKKSCTNLSESLGMDYSYGTLSAEKALK